MKAALFVLWVGALTCVSVVRAACDQPKLNHCSSAMTAFWNWNFASGMLWKDYTYMANFLTSFFSQKPGSMDNYLRICNGFEQFYGCMYKNEDCFSIPFFLRSGLSPVQAFSFAGLLQQYKFECGAGLYTAAYDNLQCIQRIVGNYNSTLTGCIQTYQNNVFHDPMRACDYYSDLMNCYSAPFNQSQCGYTGATDQWWACEAIRQFAMPQFPNCRLTCDLHHGPPGFGAWLNTHHKFEKNAHWFKLPHKVVKVNGALQKIDGEWLNN